jgi:hypothetical protein
MNETDKLIENQFSRLPEAMQKAIKAVPWKALVQEIGKTNALDIEQIVSLEQETMFIIYGFENPDDYISNIVREVGIDETRASTIAELVSEKILTAIENKMAETPAPDVTPDVVPTVVPDEAAVVPEKDTSVEPPPTVVTEEKKIIPEEKLKTLPEAMQKAINIVPWKSSVKEIALLNRLGLEQVASVERETMSVIFGLSSPDDYVKSIIRETGIDEKTAAAIAGAVKVKIFDAIARKAEELEKQGPEQIASVPAVSSSSLPEIAPNNLPMVEKGETAHDVPHLEQTSDGKQPMPPIKQEPPAQQPPPDYRYPNNKDPYREPLK